MSSFKYKVPAPKEVPISSVSNETQLSEDIEENLNKLLSNVERCVPEDYNVKNFKILVRLNKYDDEIKQACSAAQQSYTRIKDALIRANAINSENFTSERIQEVLDLSFYENKYAIGDGLSLVVSSWAAFFIKVNAALAAFFFLCSVLFTVEFLPLVVTFLSGSFLVGIAGTDRTVRMLFALLMLYPFMIAGYFFSYVGMT